MTCFWTCASVQAGAPAQAHDTLRLPVTADTFVSAARGEEEGNNGGASRLKVKSCQEWTLLDFDPAPLSGRVIVRATLHVRALEKAPLLRATVSSVASPWVEGGGRSYARVAGAASFRWAETGRRRWSGPGGDLSDVILGAGHTRWASHEPTPPDSDGAQALPVDPLVLATRVAGLGYGCALFDDIGSEYHRDGDRFAYFPYPNRFFASREAGGAAAPYFEVELGARDEDAPAIVHDLRFDARREELCWTVPADMGAAGTLGFLVRFTSDAAFEWTTAREVPTRCVSQAGAVGADARAELAGLGLPRDTPLIFGVRAVDAAGNASALTLLETRLPPEVEAPALETVDEVRAVDASRLGDLAVGFATGQAVVELTRDEPPPHDERACALHGARNEWVDFQIRLTGPVDGLRARVQFEDPALRVDLYAARGVATPGGRFPDPLEPWDGRAPLERASTSERTSMILVDVFVGGAARAGLQRGRVVLERDGETLVTPLTLHVSNFTLPNELAFVPEMNAYDLAPPPDELAWYALAHAHRVNLNVLRYDWKGRVHAGAAPAYVDGRADWKDFDARFGPLFTGAAFSESPRGAVPVEQFYLPLNENWPVPIEPHFRGGYWADTALDEVYWREFARAAREITSHVVARGWKDTRFQFYLNDKIYHKGDSWSGSSAPWIFDEPTHTQDFFALATYGRAFARGVEAAGGASNVVMRVDISRPQWQRDFLDGLVGVRVVGSAFEAYSARVLDTKERFGERLFLYATTNAVGTPNTMPVAWCIDAYCRGADGVIPWQTIGSRNSWDTGDPLALFYPSRTSSTPAPVASLRLKAFRRGQQDVEYLAAWKERAGCSRAALARRVREIVDLRSNARARFEDDAGELEYPRVTERALEALRRAIAAQLAGAH